ncbi:MAG: F0F1 ATP synthase subunit B [Armatimonadetes bacterium]|nr:F0F1 ATP synthase subunit B [Anaerolineae bacterium]
MRINKSTLLVLVIVAMLFAVSPALAAEEDAGPLGALGINLGYLVSQIINFGLILFLLTRFLWDPITNMLEARSAKIQKGLEDGAAAANARRNAEAEAEKVIAAARQEANKVIEDGRVSGEDVGKQESAIARAAADKIRADARAEAATYRDAELANMRGQVANIGVAIAQRLIGDSLVDKSRQQAIINSFFTNVPADAKNLAGRLEVVSAMPLDDGEQNSVKQQLGASEVDFKVDPAILGGLIVRSTDRVIDGSIRSGLGSLAGRLN